MNASEKNAEVSSEDIDLLLLLERCLAFLKRFKWVFVIGIVMGLSSGFFVYRSLPKVYKSRMILHSFLLTNQELIAISDNWNELLNKHEYATLAQTFNCPASLLAKVKQIKTFEIQKIFTPTNPNGFYVDVTITDNSILDSLQKVIVFGYENTPYIRQRIDTRIANLKELVSKTSEEIKKLDSTKRLVQDIMNGKGKSSSALMIDGSTINRQLIEMNQKLLGFKEDLQFVNAIQVFQGFSRFDKPAGPRLLAWLAIGLIFFLSLTYIYALISSINSKLRDRRRNQNGPPLH